GSPSARAATCRRRSCRCGVLRTSGGTLALRSPHLPCTESLCLLLLRGGHLHPEKAAPFACGLLASSRASGALLRRPASTRESEPPRSLSAWRWCDAT